MEALFLKLPVAVNALLLIGALYVVTRASHYMVDGAIHIAHEFHISPLIIGATVVAMGTSSAELAVNLVIVLSRADTSAVVGNILGSNLVNFGVELGMSALIAGLIVVPRAALEKDIPLYLAATGLMTALAFDGLIGRVESALMLAMFLAALYLIVQYAKAKRARSVLLVEVTEIETISHPAALHLTRQQAMLALVGGLVVLVAASRLLILNCASLAHVLNIPRFIIGLVIIGPGTSLPEIASSIQAARRGHAGLVLGTAFGSNLFNLLFGLGLPALIRPLVVGPSAKLGFVFMDIINLALLALLLLDFGWLGKAKTINRVGGVFLIATYAGFISYQVVNAAGGTLGDWLKVAAGLALVGGMAYAGRRGIARVAALSTRSGAERGTKSRILCATRGGRASLPTHEKAIDLAKEMGAELLFLYVFDQSVLQKVATPIVINVEEQVKQMLAYLQQTAQEQARQAGVPARVIVRAGHLRDQIKSVVGEEAISLIVLGRPSGQSSLFQSEALTALAAEIEQTTQTPVYILNDRQTVA